MCKTIQEKDEKRLSVSSGIGLIESWAVKLGYNDLVYLKKNNILVPNNMFTVLAMSRLEQTYFMAL